MNPTHPESQGRESVKGSFTTAVALTAVVALLAACGGVPTGSYPYGTAYNPSYPYGTSYGAPYDGSYPTNTGIQSPANLPTGTVTGKVLDSVYKQGIAGALVEVNGVRPLIGTMTDAAGNFTLANVPQGRQRLTVRKENYTHVSGNIHIVVDVVAGTTTTTPSIKLVPARGSSANAFIRAFDNFVFPRGIAIDAEGTLFVVDVIGAGGLISFDRAEVKKMNGEGGVINNFGANLLTITDEFTTSDLFKPLQKAHGVAVDKGGNIYVANTGRNVIRKYGPTGRLLATIDKHFKGVMDVGCLNTGDLVVSDPGNSRVMLLDSSGTVKLETLGGPVPLNSDGVRGVAVDNNNHIYVVDANAPSGRVVTKYDEFGRRLPLSFGSIGGIEPGFFNNPTDLAIDNRNGDIYVVDSGNNRVQRFDNRGQYMYPDLGSFGALNGLFDTPWGIAIDQQGYIYVTDSKNKRVQKFMPGRSPDADNGWEEPTAVPSADPFDESPL